MTPRTTIQDGAFAAVLLFLIPTCYVFPYQCFDIALLAWDFIEARYDIAVGVPVQLY